MMRSTSGESQVVDILKEADAGVPVADLTRTHGLGKATLFKWRSQYADVTAQAYTLRATARVALLSKRYRSRTTAATSATPPNR